MTIPADYVLKSGWYRHKPTGQVAHYCNCGKQPAHLTLRHIAANRNDYEVMINSKQPAPMTTQGTAQ